MFEAYIRSLISSFLGNFFENIDATPVEVSFWRGDIVLRNVEIKSTVMVDFYLPFKIIAGRVGTITLSVPWSQVYTGQVIGTVKDLYLIISPCQTAPYNPEEEEEHEFETKMRLVEEIEEKRRVAQASSESSDSASTNPTTNYKETLLMLFIKNLHLKIDGIHIRYEDSMSNPIAPFCFGIVLHGLDVHTASDNVPGSSRAEDTPVKTFYKDLTLRGLAAYLNSDGNLFGTKFQDKGEILQALQTLIDTNMHTLKYLIGPISTEIKLRFTPNPASLLIPFSQPRASIEMSMEQLTLGISNLQFQNLLRLIETVEFMSRGRPYRKFRPAVGTYAGNGALWWQFAYDCITSEIREKRQSWNYSNIKNHRELSRLYAQNYYQKIVLHNTSSAVQNVLTTCEKALDVFNIVYIRAQVQVKKESVDNLELETRRKYGWLSNILGWNAAKMAADLEAQLQEALSEQEKVKLNRAMGLSESALPTIYPQDYVAYSIFIKLNTLNTFVTDYASTKETRGKQLVKLTVKDLHAKFEYRPAISGINFKARVATVEADTVGTSATGSLPILKTQTLGPDENFLELDWEKRPLNLIGHKRIRLTAKALEIIYNAKTLQQIRSCFSLPKEIELQALKLNAKNRLNEYKENFSVYLQDWIQKSSEGGLILKFEVDAPYIIIPENGELKEKSNALIIDCGQLAIQSKIQNLEGSDIGTATLAEPFTASLTGMTISMAVPGLENGVLLPLEKRLLEPSAVASMQNLGGSILNFLVTSVRASRNTGSKPPPSQEYKNGVIFDIMNPVAISATVSKWEEESIISAKISDITLRFNSVSTELFRRISHSWIDDYDFDLGINRFLEDCTQLQNLHDRSSPYVLNSAIHNYARQMKQGEAILNNIKIGRENLTLEKYIAHVLIGNPSSNLFLLTSSRIFFFSLIELPGKPMLLWDHAFAEFAAEPTKSETVLTGNGIIFTLKEPLQIFNLAPKEVDEPDANKLFVPIEDPILCEWMFTKVCEGITQQRLLRACDDATTMYTH